MCAYDTRWQLRCIACTRPAAATGSPEGLLQGFQFGKRQHQPFAALAGKVHLNPGLCAGPFKIQHYTLAKYRVAYRLAQRERRIGHAAAMEQAAAGLPAFWPCWAAGCCWRCWGLACWCLGAAPNDLPPPKRRASASKLKDRPINRARVMLRKRCVASPLDCN